MTLTIRTPAITLTPLRKKASAIMLAKDSDMLDLSFLIEFNGGLEENAELSRRLNERFLEEKLS